MKNMSAIPLKIHLAVLSVSGVLLFAADTVLAKPSTPDICEQGDLAQAIWVPNVSYIHSGRRYSDDGEVDLTPRSDGDPAELLNPYYFDGAKIIVACVGGYPLDAPIRRVVDQVSCNSEPFMHFPIKKGVSCVRDFLQGEIDGSNDRFVHDHEDPYYSNDFRKRDHDEEL